ncbi:MAG: phenylalanine--tRNA ligase subunit beta, partial [Actinomycetales bacterium]
MRVPLEWLRSLVSLPDVSTEEIAERLTMFDLKLEEIVGGGITGPLTAGRVLEVRPEEQKNGKVINWCRVDVGALNEPSVPDAPGDDVPSRGIICGAHNFKPGDLVVVS